MLCAARRLLDPRTDARLHTPGCSESPSCPPPSSPGHPEMTQAKCLHLHCVQWRNKHKRSSLTQDSCNGNPACIAQPGPSAGGASQAISVARHPCTHLTDNCLKTSGKKTLLPMWIYSLQMVNFSFQSKFNTSASTFPTSLFG